MLSDLLSDSTETHSCTLNPVEAQMGEHSDLKQNTSHPGSKGPVNAPEGESLCPDAVEQCQAEMADSDPSPGVEAIHDEQQGDADNGDIANNTEHLINETSSVENSTTAHVEDSLAELQAEDAPAPEPQSVSEPDDHQRDDAENTESRDAAAAVVEGCLQKVFAEARSEVVPSSVEDADAAGLDDAAADKSDQESVDMDVDPSPAEGAIMTTIYSGAHPAPIIAVHADHTASSEPQSRLTNGDTVPTTKSSEEHKASAGPKAPSPAPKKKGNDTRAAAGRRRSPPRARSPFRRIRRSPFRGPRSPPRGRRSPPRRRSPARYRSLSPRRRDRALEPGDATCQIICLGTAQSRYTAYCMDQIRSVGISCSMRYLDQQSLSAVMGAVVHSRARYVIIIGKENELKGTVNFKVLSDKERKSVATTIENAISVMVDCERPMMDRERVPRAPYPGDFHARDPRSLRHDDYDNYSPRYPEPERYQPEPDRYAPEPDRYAHEPDRYAPDRYSYERDPYSYPLPMPPAVPPVSMYAPARSRDYSPPRDNYSRYGMPPASVGTYSPPRDLGTLQHSRYQPPPVLSTPPDGFSRYSSSQVYSSYDPRSTPAVPSSTYDPYASASPRMPASRFTTSSASFPSPPPRSQYDPPYEYQY